MFCSFKSVEDFFVLPVGALFHQFRSGSLFILNCLNSFQYYLKTGTCKFGATCKFHHPRDKAGIAGRVPLNVLGYPLRPVWTFSFPSSFLNYLIYLCKKISFEIHVHRFVAQLLYKTLLLIFLSFIFYCNVHPDWLLYILNIGLRMIQ